MKINNQNQINIIQKKKSTHRNPRADGRDWLGDMPLIYRYLRQEAIEDGVLIDLSHWEVAGIFKYPVACTSAVWEIIDRAVQNKNHCNDYEGVLHDIFNMAVLKMRQSNEITCYVLFTVIITGAGRKRNYEFKIHIGPGDNHNPVLTIMLPDED